MIRPLVRRGLSRVEAAIYIGVGVTKFDALVTSGAMPKPKRIDGRRVERRVCAGCRFTSSMGEPGNNVSVVFPPQS